MSVFLCLCASLLLLSSSRSEFVCKTPDCEQFESQSETTFLVRQSGTTNTCQDLDSPDCPYNYNNTMPDYVEGADVSISPTLLAFMKTQLNVYLEMIYKTYPPSKFDTADVFTGTGGRAYMFLRLFQLTKNATYLETAHDYITTSLNKIDTIDSHYVGFLWGKTGVYSLAAVISSLRGDSETAATYVSAVQSTFDRAVDDNNVPYDDFDSGRAGLLYAGQFLAKFYARDVISRSSVVAVAQATIARGQALSAEADSYCEWISPNDGEKWLGQSHGSAGVLHALLEVPELMEEGSNSRKMIIGTLDHLVSKQFPSGNFPSEYYDESVDKLVQWDHGAPGVMGALVQGWKMLNNATYLTSAQKAADCTWERGIVTKGLMLCHGITGNSYMQLYLYKITGDKQYLYRGIAFQEFVSQTPDLYDVDLMRKPTPSPYYFFPGSYESAVMIWSDLIANADNLGAATALSMPAYDVSI